MIIETYEPNKHRITLRNGAKLDIAEGVADNKLTGEDSLRIVNCDSYTRHMLVPGMDNYALQILLRKKEPAGAQQ